MHQMTITGRIDKRFKPWPQRYWDKVDVRGPDECWPWLGAPDNDGYGRVNIDNQSRTAHSVGLEIELGRPIRPGYIACHTCDMRLCQNPRHLYEGTDQTNARDMVTRNRYNNGATVRTISDEERVLILSSDKPARQLARELGFTHRAILNVRRRGH
jgi:hypothetical protein